MFCFLRSTPSHSLFYFILFFNKEWHRLIRTNHLLTCVNANFTSIDLICWRALGEFVMVCHDPAVTFQGLGQIVWPVAADGNYRRINWCTISIFPFSVKRPHFLVMLVHSLIMRVELRKDWTESKRHVLILQPSCERVRYLITCLRDALKPAIRFLRRGRGGSPHQREGFL